MATAAEIQIELDAVNTAINRVLVGGQEYALDTGQTTQKNRRASLKDLREMKQSLESDLSLAINRESCTNRGRGVF